MPRSGDAERRAAAYQILVDEEKRLIATLIGERSHLHAMATLAINTGLTANELFSLEGAH